jgi:hypothetical protein
MQHNLIDKKLQALSSIMRVEVSPFLYNRILNKIEATKVSQPVSSKTVWAFACTVALLLVVNITVIKQQLSIATSSMKSELHIVQQSKMINYE